MSDKTKRLYKDKQKTDSSYQNNLSPDEIKEKLEEYKKVEDISKVALDAHLRYFTVNPNTGEKLFRLGGFLKKIDLEKGYLVLSNGSLTWSVQIASSIFFQKMTFLELKKEIVVEAEKKYESKLQKLISENKKLKATLKEIKSQAKKSKKNSTDKNK